MRRVSVGSLREKEHNALFASTAASADASAASSPPPNGAPPRGGPGDGERLGAPGCVGGDVAARRSDGAGDAAR